MQTWLDSLCTSIIYKFQFPARHQVYGCFIRHWKLKWDTSGNKLSLWACTLSGPFTGSGKWNHPFAPASWLNLALEVSRIWMCFIIVLSSVSGPHPHRYGLMREPKANSFFTLCLLKLNNNDFLGITFQRNHLHLNGLRQFFKSSWLLLIKTNSISNAWVVSWKHQYSLPFNTVAFKDTFNLN